MTDYKHTLVIAKGEWNFNYCFWEAIPEGDFMSNRLKIPYQFPFGVWWSLFYNISLLSQHPFPRRKNMNLLAIYLKFFLLLHRKNISLSQAISIHGFHQPLDFSLASFLVIHHYRYLISLHDSHALSNNKVALLLICMIKNIISAAFQLDEYIFLSKQPNKSSFLFIQNE